MLSTLFSSTVLGIDAFIVPIEIDIQNGMPNIQVVGLPDTTVREAKDRIKAAITNSGFQYPWKRITINLAPADIRKEGSLFDLPMAIGMLSAYEQLPPINFEDTIIIGELALNGDIRPIHGALSIASAAKEANFKSLILPKENAKEAAVVEGINCYPVSSLTEAVQILADRNMSPFTCDSIILHEEKEQLYSADFSEIKGQYNVKRAVEVACAGNHNILLVGPPGCGKTMIAKRIPTILPQLSLDEAIECTKLYSISGLLETSQGIIFKRPFRSPHHTASDVAIVGGGTIPKPGEISLAHNGVLFLDEFPEFKKPVLQVLRQPMEERKVTISRSERSLTFPANFMLIAAMNPCPCGYFNHPDKRCKCSLDAIKRYLYKISGPIFDRIDIQVEVTKVNYDDMISKSKEESSFNIRERIKTARYIQAKRLFRFGAKTNSDMNRKAIEEYCGLNEACHKILKLSVDKLGMSARAFDKVLRVSRTIADLDGREKIEEGDIMEALQYRMLDRLYT